MTRGQYLPKQSVRQTIQVLRFIWVPRFLSDASLAILVDVKQRLRLVIVRV